MIKSNDNTLLRIVKFNCSVNDNVEVRNRFADSLICYKTLNFTKEGNSVKFGHQNVKTLFFVARKATAFKKHVVYYLFSQNFQGWILSSVFKDFFVIV